MRLNLFIILTVLAAWTATHALAVPVLPAGQEPAIEAMIGGADTLAGCKQEKAQIERARIFATWQCPTGPVTATLSHASAGAAGDTVAGNWAVSSPVSSPSFVAALVARVHQFGPAVRWQDVEAEVAPADPATPVSAPAKGDSPFPPVAPMSPEAWKLVLAAQALQRHGKAHDLLPQLQAMVRKEPHSLLLAGIVVATVSRISQPDGREWVDQRMVQADAAPDDALLQFSSGVGVHYRGHGRATSKAQKDADYRRALHHLERVKAVYAKSPRVWIYLAISNLRLGRQAEAEAAIAQAVQHDDGGDADIYYCRAEVWHRKDPKRALADIERYQEMMKRNAAGGGFSAPEKEGRVEAMRDMVAKVAAGKAEYGDVELFDPIELHAGGDDLGPRLAWLAVGALGLLTFGLVWRWRRTILKDKDKA